MTRTLIKIIVGYTKGVLAFIVYIPFVGIVFSITYGIYRLLKYVPCTQPPCTLRSIVYWAILVIHDTLLGLPVFFVFGTIYGLLISKYYISRPSALFLGFLSGWIIYHIYYSDFGFLPLYVEAGRLVPIFIFFIIFVKMGHTVKLLRQVKNETSFFQPPRH